MDPSDEKKEMDREAKDSSQYVRVAVNIRPLVTPELLVGCTDCISVVPGEPKVQIRTQAFTFDYVFGSTGLPSYCVFDKCVAPLVDALFQGYNGTVLAYGQTGSGKSYTMGTNYKGDEDDQSCGGVIPKVMETIYSRVDALKDSTEFLIRVSFIEIHNEEVFDLLDPNPLAISKADGMSLAKPARSPIQMRETVNGGITLAGLTEPEVRTKEEMATLLLSRSVSRATGSTNMNSQSSLSHAIFTISMEQKRIASSRSGDVHDDDDILSAKLHLVDLAGSESAKCSGADGMRLREGIHISKGLLALGNVISALGDDKKRKEGGHVPYRVSKWTRLLQGLLNVISALGDDRKRKEGGHVPYRDSKLTHLLQDSLGGNSKTVMIACVSPADTNAEETLNTLKYADRARNIQNKAVINRDPMAAQMQRMRNQIELLQSEVQHKDSLLEASNAELQRELQERQISFDHLAQTCLDAQVDMDTSVLKQTYEKKVQELEMENRTYEKKVQELEMEKRALQKENEELRHNLASISSTSDDGAQKLKTDVGYYGLRPKGIQNCGIPCGGNNDIDTSDSGHSDMDRDDEDCRPPTYISNPSG